MSTALSSNFDLDGMKHTAVVAICRFPCLHQAARRFATNLERKTEQETKPKNQKRIV